jgi:hypothetical protein
MKRTFLPILAAFALIAAASASFAQTASAVGSWNLTVETPNGKRSVNLVIKQEGDKLTGLMKSERGDRPLESVTLKGNEITLVQKIQAQGQELVVTYKGTVEKDSMKGDADFGGFAQGTWSAVPYKEGAGAPSSPAPQAGAAAAGNISGVWNFTVETSAGTGSPVFTLKQEGEQLTGTYKGQFGEGPVNGTVKGGDVKIVVKVNAQGQDLEITYTGKVEGPASMKGKVQLGGLGEGNWSAKKQ